MAHELDFSTGRAAFMSHLTPAWHGLGRVIDHAATSAEALTEAALDWKVELQTLQVPSGRQVAGAFATVRTDTGEPLGVVGDRYTPFQNVEAFAFMDSLVGEKLAMFETAGALRSGRTVFMLAKLPHEHQVAPDDVLRPYMLLANTHDGTGSLKVFPTSVRVVCANTLRLASQKKSMAAGISIRHTASLKSRVESARQALGIVAKSNEAMAEQARTMAARKLTVSESRTYFENLFPTKATAKPAGKDGASLLDALLEQTGVHDEVVAELLAGHEEKQREISDRTAKRNREITTQILENYDNSRNKLRGIEHSAWAAYNAVSEYVDHDKKTRGRDIDARKESRFESVLFGAGHELKATAYDSALALAR